MLGTLHHSGSHGIALNIPRDSEQVCILLDWKTLESTLVKMPVASGMPMLVPADGRAWWLAIA